MIAPTLAVIDELTPKCAAALEVLARSEASLLVLTCNDETFAALNEGPHTVCLAQELFGADEVLPLDDLAVSMIRTRFFKEPLGRDISEYAGLPIADIGEQLFVRPVIEALRAVVSVGHAIDRSGAGRVVLVGPGNFTRLAQEAAKAAGIPCRSLQRGPVQAIVHSICTVARFFGDGRPLSTFKTVYLEPILTALLILGGLWARLRMYMGVRVDPLACERVCVISTMHILKPVYERLRQSGQWGFIIMGLDFFGRRRNFPGVMPIEAFMGLAAPLKALGCFMHYARLWVRLRSDRDFIGRFEHNGVSFWPAMKGVIRGIMLLSFPRIYFEHLLAVDAIKHIKTCKAIVVSPFDSTHDIRTLVDVARSEGVATLLIQHALMGENTAQERIFSETIAGWGERSLQWFGQYGYPVDRIALIGSPPFDARFQLLGQAEDAADSEMPELMPGKKTILVITSGGDGLSVSTSAIEDYYMLKSIYEAVELLALGDKVQVTIKMHPNQNIPLLMSLIGRLKLPGLDVHLFFDRLDPLLKACHVVVGRYSTALLEAMIFGKSVVVFDYLMKKVLVPYVPFGAALGASDSDGMARALGPLLEEDITLSDRLKEGRKRFIQYVISDLDGMAMDRLEALINGLADDPHMDIRP